jgi:GNAT superfamily N-acetyltransferase
VAGDVVIRSLNESDSLAALTDLVHRAYAPLGALGLNYTAVDQSVDETATRIARGECAVACIGGLVIGTVIAAGTKPKGATPWFREPFVATAHQLAVEPSFQRHGVGSALMQWAESWAFIHHYTELAVDTAEPAEHLVAFYTRRGYRFIEFAQWQGKRYRSVILSKSLTLAP